MANRIAYDGNPSLHAQEIVNCYLQDNNITVSYMPSNPKECVLEAGVDGSVPFELPMAMNGDNSCSP